MPKHNCLICATDDGLFLDVFTHGKDFRDIIENYLFLKVQKDKLPLTEICYKCAYELTECNKFITKFNQAHENTKKQSSKLRGHCNLCSEPGKKGFIYQLQNDALNDVCTRIQDLFDHDVSSTNKPFSVCLYCRYNLDVLSDLKKVAKKKSTKDDSFFKLPKVNVSVIKRKTTSIPPPSFSDTPDTDSSASRMSKKKFPKFSSSISSNDQQCDKCELKMENAIDMYRFHHTGQKVCKDCWLSMDPVKLAKGRKHDKTIESSTKLCTVVLKDVLTNPPDRKSRITRNSQKQENTELDSEGNIIYVISDDSEMEHSPVKSNKGAKRASSENDTLSTKKAKQYLNFTPQRSTRAMSVMSTVSSTSQSSRPPPKRRHSDNFEVPDAEPKRLRTRPSRAVNQIQIEIIEDKKPKKSVGKLTASVPAKSKTPKKSSPVKTVTSSDEGPSKHRKIVKSSSQVSDNSDSPSSSRRSSVLSLQKEKIHENDIAIAEEGTRRSQRIRKPTKHWSETSESGDISEEDGEIVRGSKKSEKIGKTRQSIDKNGKTFGPKSRGKGVEEKIDDNEESHEEMADSDGDSQPYTCNICDIGFETKVEGMTHELTHSKKLGVVLEKVSVSESLQDDAVKEGNITDEVAKENSMKDPANVADAPTDAVDASEVTKNPKISQDDEKPDEKDAKDEEAEALGPEIETPTETKASEKSLETAKDPEEEAKAAESKEVDEEDKTATEKLPEINTSNEIAEPSRCEEKKTEESSKNDKENVDKADDADKETEPEKNDENDESITELTEDKPQPEEKIEKIASQRCENDNEDSGRQSPVISEATEKEDVQNLTNGENVEASLSHPEDENDGKKEVKVHDDDDEEEKIEKVDEDKSKEKNEEKIDENKDDDGDKVDKCSEQKVKSQEVDQNEDEDWESDEEKSPEAEPLSPPRRDESTNGDADELPEEGENNEREKKLVEKNNEDVDNKVKELESNSNEDKSQETNTKLANVTDDAGDSSEAVTQVPEGNIDVDEASMDAIERQMETIVGEKMGQMMSVD